MANVVEIIIKGIDRTKQGFTDPIKSLADLEKSVNKVAPLFVGLTVAAEAAFLSMAKHFVNFADEMGKTAQKAGTTTEAFSRMAYAGALADVSADSLKIGFKGLSEQLVAVNQGSPEAIQLFRDLGITAKDSAGAILQIADKFEKTADGAGKTAAAVKLFGKSGQDLIPLLNQGSEGLRQLSEESDAFGQTISTDASKNAEEFNDNMTRMKLILQGVVNQVVTEFLPTMAEWSAWLVKVTKENGIIQGSIGALIDTFKVFAYVIELVVAALKAMYNALVLIGDFLGSAISTWLDGIKIFADAFGTLSVAIEELVKGHFSNAKIAFKETLDGIQVDFTNFKSGLKEVGKGLQSDWANIWQGLASGPTAPTLFQGPTIGPPNVQSGGPLAPLKQQLELNTVTDSADRRDNEDQIKAMELERQFQADQLQGMAQQMAMQDNLYSKRLEQIGKLHISEEQALSLSRTANQAHTKSVTKLYADQFSTVGNMFSAFGDLAAAMGKKNTAAYKAMMYVQAIVSTAAGVARAFADYVWPYSMVVAATVGAAGAAQIATIASAGGQAHAGADYIPSEATYLLQQGERVLAPKQNEDLTNFLETGEGGGGRQVIENRIFLDGREILRYIHDSARNGELTIDPRAVRQGI